MVPRWPGRSVRNIRRRFTNSFCRTSHSFRDVTKTSLVLVSQSADAFPLLKSACRGVLEIWLIAERIKTLRDDAQRLVVRCAEIVEVIKSVPDTSTMPPDLQERIKKFIDLLDIMKRALDLIEKQKWFTRFRKLNRNEGQLHTFDRQLDEAYRDIIAAATLQTQNTIVHTSQRLDLTSQQLDVVVTTTKQIEAKSQQFENTVSRFTDSVQSSVDQLKNTYTQLDITSNHMDARLKIIEYGVASLVVSVGLF